MNSVDESDLDMEKPYTTKEVAAILTVHQYTVYKLLSTGELKGFRIHTEWRIPRDELRRFMSVACEEDDE